MGVLEKSSMVYHSHRISGAGDINPVDHTGVSRFYQMAHRPINQCYLEALKLRGLGPTPEYLIQQVRGAGGRVHL